MPITPQEQQLLDSIDVSEMWRHLEYLCAIDRTSGSPGELQAAEYIAAELRSYGCYVEMHRLDAYLSYPRSASLRVAGVAPGTFPAKTRSFSASTPPGGVSGEIIYVPGSSDMFTDTETVERLLRLDLAGKVVLSEGGGRQNMLAARQRGAVAYIHLWSSDEDVIHEGIATPIWGTPAPGALAALPGIPVISVKRLDGLKLREAAAERPVVATIHTEVETGWHSLVLPEAVIPGRTSDFVLIAGHLDSWHLGATDNATGNVSCLELARVLAAAARQQGGLERGVRIAWWPGHSTGRYAGSTWYCDHYWQLLHDHCVTYINIDSPGCLGAYDYSAVTAVAENAAFAQEVVRELTGTTPEIERPVRAGDQSFWGPGVSSLFMLLSNRPPGQRAAVGGSGMGWWWHTEQDTIDKVEAKVLELDTRIYALAAWRLCTAARLPFRLRPLAAELEQRVAELAGMLAGTDANPLVETQRLTTAAQLLTSAAARFDERADEAGDGFDGAALAAIRWLTPVSFSAAPAHEHGPATPTSVLPLLAPLERLARMEQADEGFGFAVADAIRRRNAVLQALHQAERVLRLG